MKKIVIFAAILSSLVAGQNAFADSSEVKLKKKCTKEYPLVQDETDQTLLGIYAQICDKKKDDEKSVLLIQAAQRYQQIGQNLKALQLINELKSQNIESTSLTDVQFLAGSSIANVAIGQMRTKEMRYLTAEETYPVAKELVDSINSAKPAPVMTASEATSDAPVAPKVSSRRSTYKAPPRTKTKVRATPPAKVKATPAKANPAPAAVSGGNNPFTPFGK